MHPAPALTLFGTATLGSGPEAFVFGNERPHQLLAYLACRGTWLSRDELAEWLWQGRDQAIARSNLRKTLLLARKLVGDEAIEQKGDRIRWLPASDLRAFESACAEHRFDDAIRLATAPLMQGMESALSSEAAQWLAFERERIDAMWHSACESRLEELTATPREARQLAERMLLRDPLDEAAVHALACAMLALGHREQAIRTLDVHARRLADELDLEPSASLQGFATQVRRGVSTPAPVREIAPTIASPAARRSFVGRRIEAAQIASLLAQKSCRVLTLTGPPGIGKSALARSVMPALAAGFADGSAWVSLEDLTDVGQVATRLALVLGIAVAGEMPAWQQIGAVLAERAMLLAFDNAEHLALAKPIGELVTTCLHIRMLVTSRARLGCLDEWLLPLEGLPLPDDDETDVEILRHYDAVQLFETRALLRAPEFELWSAAGDVVRLLHLVEGLPLAIELSAAWTRVMPVADIVSELSGSLDLLESDCDANGERGLRASFEQSWSRLTADERTALSRLALLPGSFSRDMARQVASASLPVIAALVDKSLVRPERNGNFSMHSLLRQCAAAHCEDADDVMERHARAAEQWLSRFRDMGQMPLADIEAELPHVRAAMRWTIEHRDANLMVSMSGILDRFFQQRGLWTEGTSLFSSAVTAFDIGPGPFEKPLLAALRALASFRFCTGDLVEAEVLARRSLKIAQRLRDTESIKSALNAVGIALCQRGRYAQSRPFFEQAQRRSRLDADNRTLAAVTGNLALADEALGQYEAALDAYRLAVNLHREMGRVSGVATNLNNMANLLRILERSREMLAPLHEALELCTTHGLDATLPFILVTLGLAHDDLGEGETAGAWFERALTEARAHGEANIEASALLGQARLDASAGNFEAAWKKARSALSIAERLKSVKLQIDCVLSLGEILVFEGRFEQGAPLIEWSVLQPEMHQADAHAAKRRNAAAILRSNASGSAASALTERSGIHDALAVAILATPLHFVGGRR